MCRGGSTLPSSPILGVIGGKAPYTKKGWWVGLDISPAGEVLSPRGESTQRRAQGGGPDELRAFAPLRRQLIGPVPLRTPITGDSTWALTLAADAQTLAAMPLLRRPLRPDPADKKPPALALRRLSGQN